MNAALRDRLWLWNHVSGSHTRSPEQWGLPGCSSIAPVAAAGADTVAGYGTTGVHWQEGGRVDGLILLGSCICDLNLQTVESVRRWIAGDG
jgi:hypothetical protein